MHKDEMRHPRPIPGIQKIIGVDPNTWKLAPAGLQEENIRVSVLHVLILKLRGQQSLFFD